MTSNTCFYCGAPSTNAYTIERLFGLKHCAIHKTVAKRDCRAHLHKEKFVDMRDAQRHPILSQFLNAIQTPFPVFRSNGELHAGWSIRLGGSWEYTYISYHDGEWKLPVRWQSPDEDSTKDLIKHAPIANFKLPIIYESVKDTLPLSLIDEVLHCLCEGVYSEEYVEFECLRLQGSCEEVPETENVHQFLYEGNVVRIMIPPPRQQQEEEQVGDPD